MNFEELEENTTIHTLRHFTNTPLNQDYSCYWCYPISSIEEISDSFKNFWIWFQQELQADTFSTHTIVSFDLLKTFVLSPTSEYHTTQLSRIVTRLLTSIQFLQRPF